MDLNLPDANGMSVVNSIKATSKDSKIIVLTSSNDISLRQELFTKGIVDYLRKDFKHDEIIKEIDEIIVQTQRNSLIEILVVDDSSLIREQLKDLLSIKNYRLYFSKDSTSAYKILKEKDSINLVLLDIELPDINGLTLLKNIKNNINKELPVIILSANYTPENYRDCFKSGASDFIKKPFIIEELLLKTDLWIDRLKKDFETKCANDLLEQYKQTVDLGTIVSKTDNRGIITYVNDKFIEISGYDESELIGKSHNVVRHEDTSSEVFKDLWTTIKQNKKPWFGKIKNKRKDGTPYYVETVINPILDNNNEIIEYIGMRTDITEVEENKQYLKEQYSITTGKYEDIKVLSENYENAINKSSIILRVSPDMKVNFVNEGFCTLTGYKKEEIEGKDYSLLKHPDISDSFIENMFKEAREKGIWKGQLKNLTKNNSTIYFISTVIPIKDRNNTLIEYMGVRLDITKIIELHKELDITQKETIYKMGEIAESRSKETGYHVKRVAQYSKLLALKAGLSKDEAELLKLASPMHDVGKVAIEDSILNKPGKLTKEEFDEMKKHTQIGYELLNTSSRKTLKAAAIVAYEHHEKWDGRGYPRGLKGEDIHIYGRITAVCDVFDALAHERPYKKAWELDRILDLFKEQRGKHFDPSLIDIFFENLDEFLKIKESY